MSAGGRDVKALAANCLRRVIRDEVGETFSLTGKQIKAGLPKQPFEKTEVYKLLLGMYNLTSHYSSCVNSI